VYCNNTSNSSEVSSTLTCSFFPRDVRICNHLTAPVSSGWHTSWLSAGVAVDASGNCYVTGETSSPDLRTTPDAVQPDLAGSKDAFFIKLLPDGKLVYSTYFADSSGETSGRAIVLDGSSIYIAGTTTASVLPMAKSSAAFGPNAFVAQFTDTTLLSSRFLGGSGTDEGNGIAIDNSGYPVVVGKTDSQDFLSSSFCPHNGIGS
jgi:hypothetical protein